MAEGTITWKIEEQHITDVTITGITYKTDSGEVVNAPCSNIKQLFLDISENIDAKDGCYSAILRIEDGSVFRTRDYTSVDGNRLVDAYTFGQKQLFFGYIDPKANSKIVREIKPILHISVWDIKGEPNYSVLFPRYSNVMDSSIWNYFYRVIPSKEVLPKKDVDHLKWIVESIAQNTVNHIYDTMNAREYADLNARITYESYIASREDSGHGADVSPFLFHSEWKMREEWEASKKSSENNCARVMHWRLLLLDDYANTPLKGCNENPHIMLPDKKTIVKRVLEEMGFQVNMTSYEDIVENKIVDDFQGPRVIDLWYVSSIKEALGLIGKYKFDIVLVDYLLGRNSLRKNDLNALIALDRHNGTQSNALRLVEQYQNNHRREYGFQFLSLLKEIITNSPNEDSAFRGPLGEQYIIFISAFTTAVEERLRAEKLYRSEQRCWYIGEGACPTNTPNLFKFHLNNLMIKRIDEAGILDLSAERILDLMDKIYHPAGKGEKLTVRKRANDYYQKLLSLHYHYHCLLQDVELPDEKKSISYSHGSVLVTHFIKNQVHLGGLLEHMVQLVHITAFGTVRQWPEMWEEYLFFKSQFDDFCRNDIFLGVHSICKSCVAQRLSKLYSDIEKHILSLRTL